MSVAEGRNAEPMGFSVNLVDTLDLLGEWGLLTTDGDLAITGWNRWLERHLGRPAEAFRGRPLFEVFPNLAVRKLDHYYHKALAGHTAILSQRLHKYVLPLPPPLAESRFEFMQQTTRIMPLVDEGAVCGTVTVIEDVTERVDSETELRERLEALREADRRKDEFLAMLAHELRNPLAPVSNAAQLLRLAGHDPKMRANATDMIERQIAHLVRLVDDLLDVSRVSRGKIALQKMPLDLAAVLQHAVETSRPLIDARRHRLTVELPAEPVRVEGDFVRLAQIVSNLLNNGAKYTDDGGEITLALEVAEAGSSGPSAVIRVRDNGRGIERAALKSLFELFYQAAQNIDRSEGGLGIGLSLVKSLVEMHGGSVEGSSAGRGKGSEFVVRLPLLQGEPPSAADPVNRQAQAGPRSRILVVDNNRDSAESMAMVLRADGHDVWTAHDGEEAVQVAKRQRPSIILMDVGLPGLSGYDACRVLRDHGMNDVFILAMTGYEQDDDRSRAQEACFDAHFVKPVELSGLRKVIAEAASKAGGNPPVLQKRGEGLT